MSAIAVDAVPPVRRIGGWVLLGVLLSMMVSSEIFQYVSSDPRIARNEQAEGLIEQAYDRGGAKPRAIPDVKKLREAAKSLATARSTDPGSAMLHLIATTALGKAADAGDLRLLQRKADHDHPEYGTIAEMFASPAPGAAEIQRLGESLDKTRFIFRLATYEALRRDGLSPPAITSSAPYEAVRQLMASGLISLMCVIGLVAIVWFIAGKASGGLRPLGFPNWPLDGPGADRLALRSAQCFALFLLVSLVAGVVAAALEGKRTNYAVEGWLSSAGELVAMLLVLGLARMDVHGERLSLRRLGLSRTNLGPHAAWGIGAGCAAIPIALGLMAVFQSLTSGLPSPEHPIELFMQRTSNLWLLSALVVTGAVTAPIFEEITFRATLLPAVAWLTKSPVWGVVISSLLFAMVHPTGIPAWPALAAVGAVSAVLYFQTGSLTPCVIMHGTYNLTLLLVSLASG